MSAKRRAVKRRALRLAVLLVPLWAAVELVLGFTSAARAPAFDDYAVLVAPVDALAQPGDVVVMAPRWAEPPLRRALGDARMPLEDVARPSLEAYPAAIEISLLGQRDPALEGWPVAEVREAGDFVVRRLTNPGHTPTLVDFVSLLGPEAAEVSFDGRPCRWSSMPPLAGGLGGHPTFPRQRFDCGSPFFNVGVTVIADQEFRPRRCLWAHPPASGALRITFSGVALGQRIVGHGGLYWMIEREQKGAPIALRVEVAGEELGRVVHLDGEGWKRFELPLGAHAGRRADVTFAVSSDDHRHRHFCFEARSQ